MKVEFQVRFMDWKPGDIAELPKDRADHYIDLKVAKAHKPKPKGKQAPQNKMATGAKNK